MGALILRSDPAGAPRRFHAVASRLKRRDDAFKITPAAPDRVRALARRSSGRTRRGKRGVEEGER
jgi:hypothetical protein